MKIEIFEFCDDDICGAIKVWNEIVSEGVAFPQETPLNTKSGLEFFRAQSFSGVARDTKTGEIVGLYILHPNNIGRCGHISNASYAVLNKCRGNKIGEALVSHCITKAREIGFLILQFNAVVATNTPALNLYKKLGFTKMTTIPHGFKLDDNTFEDIIPHFIEL